MNKKVTIIALIIVLIIIGAYFYYASMKSSPSTINNVANGTTSPEVQKVQSAVSSGVSNANPFDVNVSPYQGYKNPFQ